MRFFSRFRKKPKPNFDFAIQDGPSSVPRRWTLECDANGNFLVWGQKLSPNNHVIVQEVLASELDQVSVYLLRIKRLTRAFEYLVNQLPENSTAGFVAEARLIIRGEE